MMSSMPRRHGAPPVFLGLPASTIALLVTGAILLVLALVRGKVVASIAARAAAIGESGNIALPRRLSVWRRDWAQYDVVTDPALRRRLRICRALGVVRVAVCTIGLVVWFIL